jgi:ubiquinol-cytochrome c reductase cytochrome b subunit
VIRLLRALELRIPGVSRLVRGTARYVFPDHWTFLFGEIALYCFVVLVVTGVYLAFWFDPSLAPTTYHGSYAPLQGSQMSVAYRSTVDLSLDTRAGLLVRQTHHWAALVFVVALVLHMLRVFFTGAFRKPRDLNWAIGLTMLAVVLIEGFAGYSLPDDLLSGMGLAIAYSVVMSIPWLGAHLALWLWNGPFPGSGAIEQRLYIAHVLLLPLLIAALLGLHLFLVALLKHTIFPGPGRTESTVVGTPLWPAYALRSVGLFCAVVAVLVGLGGLAQINPVWQYGPFETWLGTNGAQPDWYLGWLIGALRLMPSIEVVIAGRTVLPNPFFGGVLFPTALFGLLYTWPMLERRLTHDDQIHHLLDRPRDAPGRTAAGAAIFTFVATIFVAGSADRIFVSLGISYERQVWLFRLAAILLPLCVFFVVRSIARELRDDNWHPLRGSQSEVVRRNERGRFE